MSQVLDFNEAFHGRQIESNCRGARAIAEPCTDSFARSDADVEQEAENFWPDISSRYSRERPAAMDKANAPGRVLLEVFLVLAGACSAVLAVVLFVPSP
jgi:hypothetical protein